MLEEEKKEEDVDWNAVAKIRASPSLFEVMKILEEKGPRAACEINEGLGVKRATVSAYFKKLRKRDLIECLTPERGKRRLYGLTDKGKEVLEKAKI